jgi:hypothetical protein
MKHNLLSRIDALEKAEVKKTGWIKTPFRVGSSSGIAQRLQIRHPASIPNTLLYPRPLHMGSRCRSLRRFTLIFTAPLSELRF